MKWNSLTSIDSLDLLLKENAIFAVFKHSTRCSISSMIKSRLEYSWDIPENKLPVYYLDLIKFRDVSNYIEEVSNVKHESPQLIVFKNGSPIYNASHNIILVDAIKEALG